MRPLLLVRRIISLETPCTINVQRANLLKKVRRKLEGLPTGLARRTTAVPWRPVATLSAVEPEQFGLHSAEQIFPTPQQSGDPGFPSFSQSVAIAASTAYIKLWSGLTNLAGKVTPTSGPSFPLDMTAAQVTLRTVMIVIARRSGPSGNISLLY